MAQATLTGRIRDFSDSSLPVPELWVHPSGTNVDGGTVFVDRPFQVSLQSDGSFSVSLEEHHVYRLEVLYLDVDRTRVGRSLTYEFRLPAGGGEAGDVIGPPVGNGLIRVVQDHPESVGIFDQYAYHEPSGNLYERTTGEKHG